MRGGSFVAAATRPARGHRALRESACNSHHHRIAWRNEHQLDHQRRERAGRGKRGHIVSTTLEGGGFDVISSGGFASFTTIDDGSVESVTNGASSLSATVNSGGDEFLFSGTAINTIVNAGGSAVVFSAATETDATVNNGGYEILAGGSATSTTLNAGGSLNLVNMAYAPGGSATVNSTGLLTVSVGGQTYQQQLAGNFAADIYQVAPSSNSVPPPARWSLQRRSASVAARAS